MYKHYIGVVCVAGTSNSIVPGTLRVILAISYSSVVHTLAFLNASHKATVVLLQESLPHLMQDHATFPVSMLRVQEIQHSIHYSKWWGLGSNFPGPLLTIG